MFAEPKQKGIPSLFESIDFTNHVVRLAEFLGNRRVVLLFAGEAQKAAVEKWIMGATRMLDGFRERDMTVLTLFESRPSAPILSLKPPFYALSDTEGKIAAEFGGAPAFYLVGKDRTIILSGRSFLSPTFLFARIDRMPTRQEEMRQRGK